MTLGGKTHPIARPAWDLIELEATIWVATHPVGLPSYDFDFDLYLACRRRPLDRPEQVVAIGRLGVISDYDAATRDLGADGIVLANSAAHHKLASDLPEWYPRIAELTPRSVWYDVRPSSIDVESNFDWPVFVKGARQTSRHRAAVSIVGSAADFERAMDDYAADPILHHQQIVVREFVPLRPVNVEMGERIPASFEFRTFWWRGGLAAADRYYGGLVPYDWTDLERIEGLNVARRAARAIAVPFLVIDIAQTAEGEWIVIECNDAQESGYGGVERLALWQEVLEIERRATQRGSVGEPKPR